MAFTVSMIQGWWVLLLLGLVEIGLGFWAAGSWQASVIVLVAWVAAAAIVYGVGQIAAGFLLRKGGHEMATLAGGQPAGVARAA